MSEFKVGTLWPFSETMINTEPNKPGVYVLFDNDEVIYIGMSKTLKDRLLQHKRGDVGPCTEKATHYCIELNDDPEGREDELLDKYEDEYGKLPRCNDRR